MSNPLTEEYLRWLVPQIRVEHNQEYWDMFSIMFEKEFVSLVPYDENRIGDGLDLRAEFIHDQRLRQGALNNIGPCSFLEVLIGLSRRLAFAAGGDPPGWAWQLILNLELGKMSDPLSRYKVRKLDVILNTVIERTYTPDGVGGFFPLAWPDDDQTRKELWHQLAAYVNELHPGH